MSSFLRSARHFFSGTLISRISGLLRDITTAAFFGVDKEIAALMLAFRLIHLPRRIFGEGAMQVAFIPQFEKRRAKDSKESFRFFVELKTGITLFLLCFIALLFLLLQGAQALDLSSDTKEILTLCTHILPSLLFICLYGMNTSLLQCEKQFFIPSVSPVLFNLSWIVGVFALHTYPLQSAMIGMAWMINTGCFLQWAVTAPQVISLLKREGALKIPRVSFHSIKTMLAPLSVAVAGVMAQQFNSAVDPLFARAADPSGPALLWYAIRLYQLPLALFGIAIASALLPSLSRAKERGDKEKASALLKSATKQNLMLMIPITIGMFLFGYYAVDLLFGRGDFTSQDVWNTTLCFWGYTPGLIPATMILILAPTFYTEHNYKVPFQGAVAAVICNCLFNSIAIFGLGMGPASVAVATSISSWINLAWLIYSRRPSAEYAHDFEH